MTSNKIHESAQRLLKRCDSRNPFKISKELGVHVIFRNDFASLKGMYKVILRNRFIFINGNLDEFEQRVICAHELGHDTLHRDIPVHLETAFYDTKNRMEYEANAFAAEILLDDNEVVGLVADGLDESGIAASFGVSVDLLLIKLSEMNRRGYEFSLSRVGSGDFLRG